MPVYNVESYFEKSLNSVLAQTFEDFELILVNDVSTDNSLLIAEDFAKKDSRILVITQPKNMGCGKARNTGAELAQGKYLLCWDPDDWVEPNYLELVNQAFDNNDVDSVWVKLWKYYESHELCKIPEIFHNFTHHLGGEFLITESPGKSQHKTGGNRRLPSLDLL